MNAQCKPIETKNQVSFNKQAVAIIARSKGELVFVVGSDNESTGESFFKLVNGKKSAVNYRSLIITERDAIFAVANSESNQDLENKIRELLKDEVCAMPSNFDNEKRVAYIMSGDSSLKFTNASATKYFKYNVSLIGNPKYLLVFKMSKTRYIMSDFYVTHVKNQTFN